jgi:cell division protein YceG involved in septum cleavage
MCRDNFGGDRRFRLSSPARVGGWYNPIATPGIASLRAALKPADTDDLYFVARPDGSGRLQFSKDIAAHRDAATRYRRSAK